jgi:hypothetical protein
MEVKDSKKYFSNILKIFTEPGTFLASCIKEKKWVEPFILSSLVIFIQTWITIPNILKHASEQALIDNIEPGLLITISLSLLSILTFALSILIVAFLLYIFFGIGGVEGNYIHFFSLTANAALIGSTLPVILHLLLVPFNINLIDKLNLGILLNSHSQSSLGGAFLIQFEFFTIWFMIIIALGIIGYSKISLKKSILITIAYFIFRTAILGFLIFFFSNLAQKFGQF